MYLLCFFGGVKIKQEMYPLKCFELKIRWFEGPMELSITA